MNQIIKNKIDFFNDFIISVGLKENNYIIINENVYKKALYNNLIKEFYSKLEPHYYESKQFYLFREITYNGFITILRQISKKNSIQYTSKIKYTNSKHYLEYYFYIPNNDLLHAYDLLSDKCLSDKSLPDKSLPDIETI